uniref:non-specific serine/threonine protein kinase n=1 Tax=Chromera velia CCMP2878 TaxID=1169474 RepID=A0A0G4G934_9ALVE|mmetsp:Transcript_11183/g.21649  ORF Transcript_11183/g.21649 Transcript_11183/m.21649 type:complete len:730 (+) Transcript_11183:213-2402(+)|eukprot:Cvel_20818.t1-p1 / transcript=Cvel_20818.t1 / gene=Cvel_20818 / organism=Chromera_velia_CCMP2878 / gene_product=Calcium-dependent protein kinase 2, putative / transcript_product=Calcium-dependent protein kinase 2, putative / location=Cvel_scaffold1903:15343-23654(-) / protein_length=729 / sequence_SO=supercontig / SO=protein_coding / is_pseudo=false
MQYYGYAQAQPMQVYADPSVGQQLQHQQMYSPMQPAAIYPQYGLPSPTPSNPVLQPAVAAAPAYQYFSPPQYIQQQPEAVQHQQLHIQPAPHQHLSVYAQAAAQAASKEKEAQAAAGSNPSAKKEPTEEQLKIIVETCSKPEWVRTSARSFFDRHDKDKSGRLDVEEVQGCLAHLSRKIGLPSLPQQMVLQQMHRFDKTGDGELDFEEFLLFFTSLLRRMKEHYTKKLKVVVGRKSLSGQRAQGKLEDSYDIGKKLGQGAFGEVFEVIQKGSGRRCVCKKISKASATGSGNPLDEVVEEIERLRQLDHPNVLRVFEYFEDAAMIYIITELCENGELFDAIEAVYKTGKRLSESWIARVFKQIVEAVSYAHANNIAHKDLKPQNVLLASASLSTSSVSHKQQQTESGDAAATAVPHVVVIDWGLAEMFGSSKRGKQTAGTPYYMAPEMWMGNYGYKCDLFSCGVILYQLLSGRLPFEADSIEELSRKIVTQEPRWNALTHVSTEAVNLCRKLLDKNEARRLSAQEALKHEWFQKAKTRDQPLGRKPLEGLLAYKHKDHLQRTALSMVVAQLSSASVDEINAAFKAFDQDANGTLDKQELLQALARLRITGPDAEEAVKAMDMDHTGLVSYSEFMAACVCMNEQLVEGALWGVFKQFDLDGNGTLSAQELQEILGQGQLKHLLPGGKSAEQYVEQMSGRGATRVTFADFREYVLGRQQGRRPSSAGAARAQ